MKPDPRILKADFYLLLTAVIWGFAFVAQRAGMEHVGPFTFNGVRFVLGALSLLPLLYLNFRRRRAHRRLLPAPSRKTVVLGGMLAGGALFLGSSLQQIGIVYTTAGKAGFITGLYVIIVPVLGIFRRQRIGPGTWLGALLALAGLYLLTVRGTLQVNPGDFLVFLSAIFWALHVHVIGWFSARMDALKLAFLQFAVCALLSLLAAGIFERLVLTQINAAALPILYAGIMSVGVAYTLQVVGQKHAPPAAAAIILSLEALFAVLGGWLLLGELLSLRGVAGCALMLAGMLSSQLDTLRRPSSAAAEESLS